MSKRTSICLAFSAAFLLAARVACASPIVFSDQMDSAATFQGADYGGYTGANFANRSAGGRHWGDEISDPSHRFDTTQVTVDRDSLLGKITFVLRTMFNGSDRGAKYADLYLDIGTPNAPDIFGYAIALGYQSQAPGVYSTISSSTANQLWSGQSDFIYGGYGQLKTSASGFDPNMALPVYARLDDGVALPGYSVTVDQADVGGGLFDLTVTVLTLGDFHLFDAFDLFWATADSGNDTFWSQVATLAVPAPESFALFMMGLLAFAGLRRRTIL